MRQIFDIKQVLKSTLIQSAGIYTITSALNAAIPFLLMPVLTRYLTPADYGMVSMFGVLVSFASAFVGLNADSAISRQYYDRDEVDIRRYISTCLLIFLCSSMVVFFAFYLLAEPLSRITSVPRQWLWAVVIVCAAQFLTRTVLVLWQVQVKPKAYGTFQIAQTLTNAGLSLLFVVVFGFAWQGRIAGQIITAVFFAIIAIYILYRDKWLPARIDKTYTNHIFKFGIPLIPHTLGAIIITMTDRLFITNMVGLESTGLYTVGYQVGMIIGILEDSFNRAYVPWLFERLKANQIATKIKLVQITYAYFVLILLIAVVLSAIAPWFLSFFVGEQFTGSAVFVLWIALGYAFDGMYKMVVNYIFYAQKTYILAWITFLAAGINVVLNYFLINMNGAIGAAQATTATFALQFLLTWFLSSRVYKMPWILKG